MKRNETELKWYEKKAGLTRSRNSPDPKKENRKNKFTERTDGKIKFNSEKKYAPKKTALTVYKPDNYLFDINAIPQDGIKILNDFGQIIESAYPLNSKQKALLPIQIRELSHNLTDERSERRRGYMNQTTALSAYVRYYTWWNLVRLTRLFASLPKDFFSLEKDSVCLDIGSGPLTVPVALFISRPELRKIPLTWYCMDISQNSLSMGENIFLSVAAALKTEPWKIIKVKGEIGTEIKQKAALVTCANVLNELHEDFSLPPDFLAKKYCEKILSYTDNSPKTKILVIEPGVPKTARLVSLMRDSFLRKDFVPVSPCTHCSECPMDGKRGGKWCNYSFATDNAPAVLKKLSEKADLPKERAVLSFFAVQKKTDGEEKNAAQINSDSTTLRFRIASDPIRLPGARTGYYACSDKGLLLVVSDSKLLSGQAFTIPKPKKNQGIDQKSGALIIEL